jgi:hypothetical protein
MRDALFAVMVVLAIAAFFAIMTVWLNTKPGVPFMPNPLHRPECLNEYGLRARKWFGWILVAWIVCLLIGVIFRP